MTPVEHVEAALSGGDLPEVRLLRPQTGDVVVVRLPGSIPADYLDDMYAAVSRTLPDGVQCLVLDSDADLTVVRKEDA